MEMMIPQLVAQKRQWVNKVKVERCVLKSFSYSRILSRSRHSAHTMGIELYYMPASAPCRSVLMLGKALDIDLNLIRTDLAKKEHLTDEFLALNPQHTIPTLNDEGFIMWESRAILIYLAEKYGGDTALYPMDPEKRAIVNQRLFFDMGTLFQRWFEYFAPQFFKGEEADEAKLQRCEEAIQWLDGYLDGKEWAAGDELTVADFAIVSTFSTFDAVGFDSSSYPNVVRWFEKCQAELPGYDLNQEGLEELKEYTNKLKV